MRHIRAADTGKRAGHKSRPGARRPKLGPDSLNPSHKAILIHYNRPLTESQIDIANTLGYSRYTISFGIKELIELGLLRICRQNKKVWGLSRTIYRTKSGDLLAQKWAEELEFV